MSLFPTSVIAVRICYRVFQTIIALNPALFTLLLMGYEIASLRHCEKG
jgi:hypothetical protein